MALTSLWPSSLSGLPTTPGLLLGALLLAVFGLVFLVTRRPSNGAQVVDEKTSSQFEAMGTITPLSDFDWSTAEPQRVYKFVPKYFITMGLSKTTIDHIIHIDSSYSSRLTARRAVAASRPEVLACLPGAEPAVFELYTYLVTVWLPTRYPTIFTLSRVAEALQNHVTDSAIPMKPPKDAREALALLNANVDEDFLMMLPVPEADGGGFALQALIWAFPNQSDPKRQLGRRLAELHGPVPAYQEKLEGSMERFFGKLEVGKVVCRSNWSVAMKSSQRASQLTEDKVQAAAEELDPAKTYLRSELQTLFVLPTSGARIMSVHEYVYPLQQIKDEGTGPEMVQAVEGLKEGNAPGMWDYKRASNWSEQVKKFLLE